MTLTTAILTYYAIGTPILLLLCAMMAYGGKDIARKPKVRRVWADEMNEAHRRLTIKK